MTLSRPADAVGFDELLRYEREAVDRWEAHVRKYPDVLDVPYAPEQGPGARMATVRDVIHHIVGVEWRYCDRLEGVPATPFEAIPTEPAAALFEAAREANTRLAGWMGAASDADYARVLEFHTISAGTLRASARKIVVHTLVHGIRTWAQLATVVRLHGRATDWYHDVLFSEAFGE